MDYQTTTRAASRISADCLIVGIYDRNKLGAAAADVDAASGGWLAMQIRRGDVATTAGAATLLPAPEGVKAERVLVVGLGKFSSFTAARFRKVLSRAMDSLRDRKLKTLAVGLTLEDAGGAGSYYLARHASELIEASQYVFDRMKSKRDRRRRTLSTVTLLAPTRKAANQAARGADHGSAIAEGTCIAKDLGILPPNVCTPSYLARVAREQAKKR
ncbi:MAG: M17 family peptidase N-terminal domain-containing protein, partial [Pseudomonadota bacterium]